MAVRAGRQRPLSASASEPSRPSLPVEGRLSHFRPPTIGTTRHDPHNSGSTRAHAPSADGARAARRPAHAGRRVPARPRARAGVPAGVGRARPAGRAATRSSAAGCEALTLDAAPGRPVRSRCAPSSHAPADVDLDGLPAVLRRGQSAAWATTRSARFEPTVALPPARDGDIDAPARFLLAPVVVAFDHVRRTVQVIAQPGHEARADEIARRPARAAAGGRRAGVAPPSGRAALRTESSRPATRTAVARIAQEHIAAGDAFQIVVAAAPRAAHRRLAVGVYRALRAVNPSPYMFFLRPRRHADRRAHRRRRTSRSSRERRRRPAADRRHAPARRRTGAADDALADELRADEKERAEHLMLVDLARNDLARVCEPGTVRVSRSLEVERYSHVMHLVSHVDGRLRDGRRRALAAAGARSRPARCRARPRCARCSSSRRSRRTRRGIYAGALGYVGYRRRARHLHRAAHDRHARRRGGAAGRRRHRGRLRSRPASTRSA